MRLTILRQVSKQWQVAILADGTIACWHPENKFPYEHSRPIDQEELASDRKELRDLLGQNERERLIGAKPYGAKGPNNTYLREIFYSGKTEFKTRTREERLYATSAPLFADGLRLQNELYNSVLANVKDKKNYICLLEHFPVYTVGLRDQSYTPQMEEHLRALGADFHRIKRGGLITFHGPGQLVAYPILNLRSIVVAGLPLGVKRYVSALEEVLIRVSTDTYGLKNVGRTENPGVWIEENRKLAAIGIQVQNGITGHGLALNCNTDLKWYNNIVACGLEGKTVSSLSKELGHDVSVDDVLQPFVQTFAEVFQTETTLQVDTSVDSSSFVKQ
ncbi:Lipoate-protein ligase B [Aphelenchoides bicaudatus]|nr:Lipoate-protein ligase B [Aphelenchoides bicaudatus]